MILIKSKKEIDFIRESSKIVAETLQLMKAHVKPGITTGELDGKHYARTVMNMDMTGKELRH